jgi:hypothetical protein
MIKVRTMVGAVFAAPVLVLAVATPGNAAPVRGVVAFGGTVTVVPGAPNTLNACFSSVAGCAPSTGAAGGAIVAKAIAGMRASVAYNEPCLAGTPLAPTGTAAISAEFGDLSGTWSGPVHAKWQRFGTIAVLTGDSGDTVAGAALFVPLPTRAPQVACGQPVDVAVIGAAAFA